jgi:hypothetical protein
MANSTYFVQRDTFTPSPSGRGRIRPRPSLLRRLVDALIETRQRQAEREVARFLESTGGKLTDTVEREIEKRLYPHATDRFF